MVAGVELPGSPGRVDWAAAVRGFSFPDLISGFGTITEVTAPVGDLLLQSGKFSLDVWRR